MYFQINCSLELGGPRDMAPVDCASDDGEESDALMRERLANSLSQSFPSSSLSHILHVNQSENVDGDRLSSSCFRRAVSDEERDS
jgi:hypothetical protein